MEIIPLINEIANTFNETFNENLNPFNLESKIRDVGDTFTLKLYEHFLNYLDNNFKHSKQRKLKYNIKETRKRTLITSVGCITVNSTSYVGKKTKQRFVLLRELLYLKPYQRLTNEAEYQLIKYAMDEIHANLQHDGNKICPTAIVHEGYEEDFVKRKKLKNVRYFSSSKLTYEELWEVVFDYVDKRYDIDKFKVIFVSGDGASGIKNYTNCFPNAKFVLDPFHYIRKHLNYIFKKEVDLKDIADSYIRNDLIDDFKTLVQSQIKKYPDQEKYMKEHMKYIINNLEGIKNQKDDDYKYPCSMEGHINQAFARYITSSPYAFSKQGLENKLKLLVYHANKHKLTIEDYYSLKYGTYSYEDINIKIKKLTNIKYDQKLTSNNSFEYKINTSLPILDSPSDNNKLKELTSIRQEIYII